MVLGGRQRVANADEQSNDDLFWAVRGGGGNFGIVTSLTFRLHSIHTVVAGPMFWPIESANEMLDRFQEFLVNAPEEIGGFFTFQAIPASSIFPGSWMVEPCAG